MGSFFEKYGQTFITLAAIIAAFVGLVTINGNRFDAQDRFNNQFFELVIQRLDAQDRLISQFNQQVTQRLDAQDRLINQFMEQVNQRFDAQDKRLDRLADEVSELRRLIVGIGQRVSRNEGEIDVIRERLRIADTPLP